MNINFPIYQQLSLLKPIWWTQIIIIAILVILILFLLYEIIKEFIRWRLQQQRKNKIKKLLQKQWFGKIQKENNPTKKLQQLMLFLEVVGNSPKQLEERGLSQSQQQKIENFLQDYQISEKDLEEIINQLQKTIFD